MPEVLPFPHAVNPVNPTRSALPLSVRNLNYTVGTTPLIRNISLDLTSNARTVIMGPNGAGKTIFIKLLHGLLQPSSGDVLWDGCKLETSVRKCQAMVFQKPVLLRRSVQGNLSFVLGLRPFSNRDEIIHQALRDMNLEHLAKRPARVLSGGEQQRLALARALILKPQVLFLDEPTANLDPASTFVIEQAILKAAQDGIKIILVTHDRHQAERLGDEIVFLHGGKLLEHGNADQFLTHPATPQARAYLDGSLIF